MLITQEMVRQLFEYDAQEPLALRWRKPPTQATKIKSGAIAGYWHTVKAGSTIKHRYVDIAGRRCPVARVVWVYVHGTDPPLRIRFIDGNRGNCRTENLAGRMGDEAWQKHLRAYRQQWRHSKTGESMNQVMRRIALARYRITPDDYDALATRQKNVCAICGRPETVVRRGKPDPLAVDHCHKTKKVRGLLCAACNNGLGRFDDDPRRLRKAAAYIEKNRG